ncbi:MAG: ATP-binding protein [Armatimonadetes bacterium]|nr:ATP-binding protein [Armatimonadota bacterium]
MLVSFSLENWMSFRDETTFSMVASRERQHGNRVPRLQKYKTRILPIAAIYGGNASGKTNFFSALSFAQWLIVRGTQPDSLIPVSPFLLDSSAERRPSKFRFELLIDENIYEYSFAVTYKEIVEEKFVLVTGNSEKVIYHRINQKPSVGFNEDASFIKRVFESTRDNQLWLTNLVSLKVDRFRPVYDWFKDVLELVAPDSRFKPFDLFYDDEHPLFSTMNELLKQFDTGIARLGGEDVPFSNIPLSRSLATKLQEDVKEGDSVGIISEPGGDRFVVTRKGEELVAKRLVTYHPKTDGTEVTFDVRKESDGSKRVIDLLPAFLELSAPNAKKVYIVDEVDRSLHTQLTRALLEMYLSTCTTDSRAQLLFTTHDVLLMDQDLLRRDEMWVAERDASGASTMFSFSEYKEIRYDKDIQKSYLQGRLGGTPRILLGGALANRCLTEPNEKEG